jgi:opacity protein-like surface antigen
VIGITFGAILGYNKAVNQAVVLGVELDGGYSGARDNEVIYAVTSSHKMPWNANLTGRIILLPTAKQDIGVYLKGGLAIQNQQSTLAGPGGYASANETKAGWTLGGGVEQKIPSWKASARVEAMYSKVSDQTVSIPGASTTLDGRSWNMKAALTWAFN